MKIAQIAAAGIFLALPGAAQAQWYAGFDGGANFVQDSDIKAEDGSSTGTKAGNKAGYVLEARGGYAFKPLSVATPRIEGELGYRNSGLKTLTDVDGVSGHTSALSFMTNGVLSFLPNKSWHPFVGAGIGMTRVSVDWQASDGKIVDDSDWVFSYQGFAGLSYDLSKNWELNGQYRYFATQDPEYSSSNGTKFNGEYASHSIMAGITYKFAK